MSLVPETAQLTSLPLIAAGGIKDGATIRASFLLGASGVQIGSAFIASDESAAIRSYKKLLSTSLNIDTVLTRSLSGRWARGIRNKMITAIESSELKIPAYPLQQALTAPVRLAAIKKNDHDFTALWAGQSAAGARSAAVADIFRSLIAQTEAII
jgi:nitronate monooxygenase